jgi:hypothetical protein
MMISSREKVLAVVGSFILTGDKGHGANNRAVLAATRAKGFAEYPDPLVS